jgi:hypothetical protein
MTMLAGRQSSLCLLNGDELMIELTGMQQHKRSKL